MKRIFLFLMLACWLAPARAQQPVHQNFKSVWMHNGAYASTPFDPRNASGVEVLTGTLTDQKPGIYCNADADPSAVTPSGADPLNMPACIRADLVRTGNTRSGVTFSGLFWASTD